MASMLNLPAAPWENQMENDIEQGSELYDNDLIDRSDEGMLLVHLNNDELAGLIALQGEEIRDEETGYYSFPLLGERAEDPEFVEMFKSIFSDLEDDQNVEMLYEEAVQELPKPEFSEKEMETESELNLSAMGEDGDDRMCFIPENFTALLIELNNGQPQINKETGLLSFGFFGGLFKGIGNIVKGAGRLVGNALPIIGSVMGGPIGGTVGKFAGQILKGKDPGRAFRSAGEYGMNAALMHGVNYLAGGNLLNPLGAAPGSGINQAGLNPFSGYTNPLQFAANLSHHANPGIGSLGLMGMNALSGGLPGLGGGSPLASLGNMFGMPSGQQGMMPGTANSVPASMAGRIFPGAQNLSQMSGMQAPGAMMGSANAGMGSSLPFLQSSPSGDILKTLLQKGMEAYNLKQAHKEDQRLSDFANKQQEYKRKAYQESKDRYNEQMKDFNAPLQDVIDRLEAQEKKKNKYAEGGLIKGHGKGQDDKIAQTIPANSYIVDALSVAHLGDGSSEAGGKVLDKFVKQIKSSVSPQHLKNLKKEVSRESPPTDVLLSNDEYRIDPLTVKIIGNSNSKIGASLLDRMREKLRLEKSLAGGGIPGKAKDPLYYMN